MYTNVLVGIDEGGGRDAITLARELVDPCGAITLAYVHGGYPTKGRGASPDFEGAERDRAQRILVKARSEAGVEADVRSIGSTSVGRGLHVLAETNSMDLIVVGSTRRSGMIGDETRAGLNGAPCAVAVAPARYATQPTAMREVAVAYDGSPESEHAGRIPVGAGASQTGA